MQPLMSVMQMHHSEADLKLSEKGINSCRDGSLLERDQLGVKLRKGGQESLRKSLCILFSLCVCVSVCASISTSCNLETLLTTQRDHPAKREKQLIFAGFKPRLPSHGACQREARLI